MSDPVGNPNCWFSHAQAHVVNVYDLMIDTISDFAIIKEFIASVASFKTDCLKSVVLLCYNQQNICFFD